MSARTIVVAGAGLGGLTAALALAARGFRVALFDKAEALAETGAGIQLSPNATRVLTGLGLRDRLLPSVVAPEAVVIRTARNAAIARLPLGATAETRYGAPYWIIHRGDLQAALLAAVRERDGIALTLGAAVEAVAAKPDGVTVQVLRGTRRADTAAAALIGADGLWSRVRALAGGTDSARFARRTAWRALVPAAAVAPDARAHEVNLWLGPGSHLVHYPVKGGAMINIVAIAADTRPSTGWSTAAGPEEVMARFPADRWAKPARELLDRPTHWLKWPLYDRPPLAPWGNGRMTLLGDAAHPMLPFLAQGAAMAIEDAAVLAAALAATPDDPTAGLRRYEAARIPRTRRLQRAARRSDRAYHLGPPASTLRDLAMRMMGDERLLRHYDWIYGWRAE
ncbi:MAG TPA: FAD-dependent monooxygenase [Xanthobacteraceae bacterium]|nr:FAD-dependent monooxygenase [Xanthobacteraceae bacterium]